MNAAHRSTISARQVAVGLAGCCAFINLYAPQSILPLLSREFGASAAEVSSIITVSTLAVALCAPFAGALADVLGRLAADRAELAAARRRSRDAVLERFGCAAVVEPLVRRLAAGPGAAQDGTGA